jgi:hypothetical protein
MFEEEGKMFGDLFAQFVEDPGCSQVRALVIGDWGGAAQAEGSGPIVEAIVSARDSLPNLRALFLGEMTFEESEISWINQSDVSPLFDAFPNLEELWIRGGEGLSLGRPRHECLKKLVIETGGLSASVVREVASASLPSLEHLELWLGDDGYGNDIQPDDLKALLPCQQFPNLKHLGLRDDCNADETAKVLAEIGFGPSVEVLDLSLGTLGDEGATALLASPRIKQLKKLDLHHHYISPKVVEQLQQLGPEIDADEVQEADRDDGEEYRYVAVSE